LRIKNVLPAGKSIIPNDPTVQTIVGSPTTEDRVAVHLHGGKVPWISDGGPFDFWDSAGNPGASFLNGAGSILDNIPGKPMAANEADYFYPNGQSTRLMWYHDHAYGITRTNAYAGIATGYAMIDPAQETALGTMVPPLTSLIPMVWQDKKFVDAATIAATDPTWAMVARPDVQTTGSLWYEHVYNPKEFKLLTGKGLLPVPDPSAIPEFFGDTMLCNGTVQPLITVEAKRYRFMMLNACNARFLNINLLEVAPGTELTTDPKTLLPINAVGPGPNMIQIGTEGGYLVKEVVHTNNKFFNPITMTGNMLLGCAERSDFIIDFTGMAGKEYIMYNDAPGPFPAGPPTTDYFIGNPKNPEMVGVLPGQTIDTRNLVKFKVGPAAVADPQPPFKFPTDPITGAQTMPREPFLVTYPPAIPAVGPIAPLPLPAGATVRNLTLNEDFDAYGRLRQMVGTTTPVPVLGKKNALAFGLEYGAAATETPVSGGVEVWNIYNLTADTHPMHFHLVEVQILQRQLFTMAKGVFTPTVGTARGPELDELGWKETCKCHPGEVITVCMKFDMPPVPFTVPFSQRGMGAAGAIIPQANEYVWHCHILEHEEHDMMRPLVVTGVNPKLLSVFPYAASISGQAGGSKTFSIFGDNPITSVVSNNANFVVNWAAGATTFTVTVAANSLPPSVATITVTDSLGKTAIATVDVFGVTPGYTAAITGVVLTGGTTTFGISGGTRPYTVTSSNAAYPATPVLDAGGAVIGFQVIVAADPLFVGPVTVNYTVKDASIPENSVVVAVTLTA